MNLQRFPSKIPKLIKYLNMVKNAIVQIDHLQYNLEEGKEYKLPKFSMSSDKEIKDLNILLVSDGEKTIVGKPFVKGAEVILEVQKTEKDKKIVSRTFRAKARYRRTKGIRQEVTTVKVRSIKF